MTNLTTSGGSPARGGWKVLAASALALATAACVSTPVQSPVPLTPPTQADIASLKPVGKVTLTEAFVGGVGAGKGVLAFRGKTYPFKLIGTVVGPGSVSKVQVSGDVYKLTDVSQFAGPWVQGTGQVGLQTSGAADLWLENKAGVIMHLVGQTEGVTLGLGEDEVLIELSK
jgi:hypothetical protein